MSFSKKVAFHTLGCKVNQYETESIKNQLVKRGYEEVPFEDKYYEIGRASCRERV